MFYQSTQRPQQNISRAGNGIFIICLLFLRHTERRKHRKKSFWGPSEKGKQNCINIDGGIALSGFFASEHYFGGREGDLFDHGHESHVER